MTSFSSFPKSTQAGQTKTAPKNPIAQLMAGFTGFAVAVTLILVTAIPVKADRDAGPCAKPAPTASCTKMLD